MDDSINHPKHSESMSRVTEAAIRLFLVAGLAFWCLLIFKPFLYPLVWGVILAVAAHPIFHRLQSLLGGRRKLAGGMVIILGVGILVVLAILVSGSFMDGIEWLQHHEAKGSIQVPLPPSSVADWPLIGEQTYTMWKQAAENLDATLEHYDDQVKAFLYWLLSTLGGFGMALILTMISIVIAGVLLVYSESGERTARAICARLGGEQGVAAVDLSAQTIRSVAFGVLGVAVVQAVMGGVGLLLAGVPGAALWAGLILLLAVAQLPPLLILGPAIIYVVATSDSMMTQVLFTIWSLVVSFSDAFLKPMFLGRGMDIPMLVILIGAIGGLMRAGIIGLFVGAVVLAIGYTVFMAWIKDADGRTEDDDEGLQV